MSLRTSAVLALILASACTSQASTADSAPPVASPPPKSTATASVTTSSSAAPATAVKAAFGTPFECGAFKCRRFETAATAVQTILDGDKPLILGMGESHAQKNDPKVPSTTARFTEELLPLFKDRATSMVLELWIADGTCGKKTEQKVAEQQKAVTKNQAEENPNEFLKLGNKSKELGITPFILRPTCAEVETIKNAGDDAPLKMLDMITASMKTKVSKQWTETSRKFPGKMVLTYGGAMHNDKQPKAGREQWSFAADLDALSKERYVELDLIVPEFIKDNPSWRALPWFPVYNAAQFGDAVLVVEVAPRSYALIFSRSPAPSPPTPAPDGKPEAQ